MLTPLNFSITTYLSISSSGFTSLGQKYSHQSSWQKSVYDVYKDAEVPLAWTSELVEHCKKLDIEFFTTPYDLDMVDKLDPFVPGFKIGSGDICWNDILLTVASKNKPILFASGASSLQEVISAFNTILSTNKNVVLMQ